MDNVTTKQPQQPQQQQQGQPDVVDLQSSGHLNFLNVFAVSFSFVILFLVIRSRRMNVEQDNGANAKALNEKPNIIVSILLHIILVGLAVNFITLEIIFMITMPLRLFKRRFLPSSPSSTTPGLNNDGTMDPQVAAKLANGKNGEDFIHLRKVVIFDGVCVLCNTSGRFVVSHLPDPNLVSFLPYQDALSNPHISLKKIKEEFPEFDETQLENKIAVISGKKLLWASDAVLEVCSWMYFPFNPFMKLGYLVPRVIRDAAYMVVARNRYRTFGTQPLEKNFAKYLCPYMYVRKYLEDETCSLDDQAELSKKPKSE